MSRETYTYKVKAMTAAKDLLYGERVIEAIRAARSISEIEKIMINARKNMAD